MQHYSPFKISSLMLELEKLKKEKTETEIARKTAEDQVESTRKDHEAKVKYFRFVYRLDKWRQLLTTCKILLLLFFLEKFNKFHTQLYTVTIRL